MLAGIACDVETVRYGLAVLVWPTLRPWAWGGSPYNGKEEEEEALITLSFPARRKGRKHMSDKEIPESEEIVIIILKSASGFLFGNQGEFGKTHQTP